MNQQDIINEAANNLKYSGNMIAKGDDEYIEGSVEYWEINGIIYRIQTGEFPQIERIDEMSTG